MGQHGQRDPRCNMRASGAGGLPSGRGRLPAAAGNGPRLGGVHPVPPASRRTGRGSSGRPARRSEPHGDGAGACPRAAAGFRPGRRPADGSPQPPLGAGGLGDSRQPSSPSRTGGADEAGPRHAERSATQHRYSANRGTSTEPVQFAA